jgi:hypothetical protein
VFSAREGPENNEFIKTLGEFKVVSVREGPMNVLSLGLGKFKVFSAREGPMNVESRAGEIQSVLG